MLPRMIRHLGPDDASTFFEFRRRSLIDAPLALTASPEDDIVSSVESARELLGRVPGSVVFGAFDEQLVGMLGFHVDRQLKRSHLGHLWGMYVAPSHRARGHAAELVAAAVAHARSLGSVEWLQLSVSSTAPAAQRLYERAGFRVWGTEPAALRFRGETTVEHHMALQLAKSAASIPTVGI